jgi:copper chaperone CopZ
LADFGQIEFGLFYVWAMRYMERMNTRFLLSFALFASLGVSACDKAETTKDEQAKPAVATKVVAAIAKPAVATATATAAAAEGDSSCAGEGGEKHDGADCMKKSAKEGEGMGCNQWDEAADAIGKKEIPADAKWQVLKVEGMTCGGCERRIIANVGELDGVVAVEADSELGQVRVAVASGNDKAGKAAATKIGELGYKVQ